MISRSPVLSSLFLSIPLFLPLSSSPSSLLIFHCRSPSPPLPLPFTPVVTYTSLFFLLAHTGSNVTETLTRQLYVKIERLETFLHKETERRQKIEEDCQRLQGTANYNTQTNKHRHKCYAFKLSFTMTCHDMT